MLPRPAAGVVSRCRIERQCLESRHRCCYKHHGRTLSTEQGAGQGKGVREWTPGHGRVTGDAPGQDIARGLGQEKGGAAAACVTVCNNANINKG